MSASVNIGQMKRSLAVHDVPYEYEYLLGVLLLLFFVVVTTFAFELGHGDDNEHKSSCHQSVKV